MAKWSKCPRCDSSRVVRRGFFHWLFFGVCFAGLGVWVMFIPPLGITAIVLGLLCALASPLEAFKMKCKDCGKKYRP